MFRVAWIHYCYFIFDIFNDSLVIKNMEMQRTVKENCLKDYNLEVQVKRDITVCG